MQVEIVSSSEREILDLTDFVYVYIPMSDEEIDHFGAYTINPCWRIRKDIP